MKFLNALLILIAGFLLVTGEMIKEIETIPANAQIDVFPKQKNWLPHNESVMSYFGVSKSQQDELKALSKLDMLANITPATYADVYKGKYKNFNLPEDFGSKSEYTIGYDQSILWSWIFGKKNRWNKDGSWNY